MSKRLSRRRGDLPPGAPTRLLLVDDHEIFRAGLRALLSRADGIKVIAEVGTAEAAIEAALQSQPDVVLMGVRLPDASGVDACREILAQSPRTRVIFLTSCDEQDAVLAAVQAGAHGFVLQQIGGDALVRTIRCVAEGQSILDSTAARLLVERMKSCCTRESTGNGDRLSPQERQVLALVAQGRTNKQVAMAMSISDKTVKNHLSKIFQKLRVTRRAEAAALFSSQQR
jgi:two-component system, NarL family, response regulator DevR